MVRSVGFSRVGWVTANKHFFRPYTKYTIDIEYNKRLDHQWPCLDDELNGGSNNIVQSNKSV